MDFILVPDALTASETRYALAQRNTMGTKVGSFSVLLETLAELWLIEPSELDWDVALQEQALALGNAFWAKSIRGDEPTTIAELKASIQFLLNHLPLGRRSPKKYPPQPIATSATTTTLLPMFEISASDRARMNWPSKGSKSVRSAASSQSMFTRGRLKTTCQVSLIVDHKSDVVMKEGLYSGQTPRLLRSEEQGDYASTLSWARSATLSITSTP